MSITGELERLILAAAIESESILLPSESICKCYLWFLCRREGLCHYLPNRSFSSIFSLMSHDFSEITIGLASIAKSFHARGWLLGTSGNLSAVVQREPLRLAMSPSGVDKGELLPQQVLLIDERGQIISDHRTKPSDESPLHLRI